MSFLSFLTFCFLLVFVSSVTLKDPYDNVWGRQMWFGEKKPVEELPALSKERWIKRYMRFWTVPRWIAEEEFENCDYNKDGEISGKELYCY